MKNSAQTDFTTAPIGQTLRTAPRIRGLPRCMQCVNCWRTRARQDRNNQSVERCRRAAAAAALLLRPMARWQMAGPLGQRRPGRSMESRQWMKQVQTSADDLELNRWFRSVRRFCRFMLPVMQLKHGTSYHRVLILLNLIQLVLFQPKTVNRDQNMKLYFIHRIASLTTTFNDLDSHFSYYNRVAYKNFPKFVDEL